MPLLRHPRLRRLLIATTWIPTYMIFHNHVGQFMWVTGPSMYPYLNTDYDRSTAKDVVWVSMFLPMDGLKRGMCVAFWSPYDPNRLAIKRVLGLAGDTVRTLPPSPPHEGPSVPSTVTVPYGHMWVEGESRHRTLDSNTYGAIPISLIVGQVKGVVWPWRRRGWLRWHDWKDEEGRVKVAQDENIEEPKFWDFNAE